MNPDSDEDDIQNLMVFALFEATFTVKFSWRST